MAIRLFNEHASRTGTPIDWKIEIHDSAYVGDPVEFLVYDGAYIRFRAEGGDVQPAPILGSSLEFSMVVQNSDHEDLITDIASAAEGRFTVAVYKDAVFHWAGVINAPEIVIEDKYYPYEFKITAVDGLALLKNYEYIQDTTIPAKKWYIRYEGVDRIIEIIDTCIKKLPHIATHFADSAKMYVTAINWYSDQDDDPAGATYDPFYYNYLDNRAFVYGQTSGNAKFTSCYDVIAQILTAFGARIMLTDGYFLMEQPEHRAEVIGSTGNYSRAYDYDLVGPTANTLSGAQNIGVSETIKKLTGGTYTFTTPVKSVRVTQKVDAYRNLLEGAYFDSGDVEVYNVGGVFGDGNDSYVRLKGSFEWSLENTALTSGIDYVAKFRIRFLLDGLYAARTLTFDVFGKYTFGAVTWGASLDYLYFPVEMERAAVGEAYTGQKNFDFLFSTDPTFSYGNLSVSIEFVELLYFDPSDNSTGTVDAGDYTLAWAVKDSYCVILNTMKVLSLSAGAVYPEKAAYEVIGNTSNSERLDINTTIGDRAGVVLNQWLGILHDTTGSGDYVYTETWGNRGGTRDRTIAQLLAQRMVAYMYYPRRVLVGTAVGSAIVIQDPINEDSTTYLLRSGTYSTARDELSGEWVDMNYTEAEFIYVPVQYDTGNYEPNSPLGGGAGGSSSVDNGSSGSGSSTGGNGIYGGSGTVADGTIAQMAGDFTFSNTSATAGEAFQVTVDDTTNSSTIRVQATDGILLQATGSDDIEIQGITRLTDIITSASLGSDQNDYAGFDGANVGRLSASTAVNITGIASGTDGRILALHNVGSNPVTLVNASASSTAANRFDIGEDYTIRASHGCLLQYDSTASRWRIVATDRLGRFAEAYTTSTATTASISATSPATNVGVAVVPKGTGALTGQVPEGTSAGGNARGQYAVDWQLIRTNASDVASGNYSTIPGGRRCEASGTYSFATGFRGTASGGGSVAFGGSGSFSLGATASGSNSFAMGPGATASGAQSFAFGAGITATYDFAVGIGGIADKYGEFAGRTWSQMQLRRAVTGTAATELFLDGSSLKATIPSGEKWIVEVACLAEVLVVGDGTGGIAIDDTYAVTYRCVIANKGGTTALVGTVQADMAAQSDATMSDATFTITADNTGDYLKVTYTGGANTGSSTQTNAYASLRVFKY